MNNCLGKFHLLSLNYWWFVVVSYIFSVVIVVPELKESKQPCNEMKVTANNHLPKLSGSSSGKSLGKVT